ncbi:MAG: aldehyde dehydrogenase (NADP(+)) [Chitinophagaceae bacterium]|nr:aldehyde dehydrogenase (NADP(+)) [Chitinophagaceae bacterium]
MSIHGKNIIGNHLSALGTSTIASYNVLTNTVGDNTFYEATEEEINQAVVLATNAFKLYKNCSGKQRAAFLQAIAVEIEAAGDELIETACKETGLQVARITGERGRTVGQLRLFASFIEKGDWVNAIIDPALPDRTPLPRPDLRQMQVPIGPVAVFGASNFPLAFSVAGGDTASALAAGCPVVFKGHPAHPATCELVATAIIAAAKKTNMPNGVFSLVQGKSIEVGQALVAHHGISAIGFTGSFAGGKSIYDTAVRRPQPIPVYAEMSSINPVVFLPGVISEKAETLSQNFAGSITLGSGQFCTNPGIFLLLKNEGSEKFIQLLSDALSAIAPAPMLTPAIQRNYIQGIQKQRVQEGAKAVTHFDDQQSLPHLLVTSVTTVLQQPILLEEVFGPSSIAIFADDMPELLLFCDALHGQLTATIHGTATELLQARPLLDVLQTKVGRLLINGFPTGVEVAHAMVHGGPYPATTASRSTSVGTQAIYRFTRPVCYQNFPDALLPEALQQSNPLNIHRREG